MKRIFFEEIVISRTKEEVWSFFRNFDNSPKWMNGVESMRVHLDSLPIKEGSIIESIVNGNSQRFYVKNYDSGNSIVLKSVIGHYEKNYNFIFSDYNGNTKVSLEVTYDAQGIVTKFISIFINKMIKKQEQGQLDKLKYAIEN